MLHAVVMILSLFSVGETSTFSNLLQKTPPWVALLRQTISVVMGTILGSENVNIINLLLISDSRSKSPWPIERQTISGFI